MKGKVDTIEKLAQIVAEGFSDVDERFEKIDERFESIEREMRNGFAEMKISLDRVDTRLSALEHAVFGISVSQSSKEYDPRELILRLEKLERQVFKIKRD